MASKTLSRTQVAQLAGFASATAAARKGVTAKGKNRGMSEIGEKGGNATLVAHGREHFIRAAHKRWGRLS